MSANTGVRAAVPDGVGGRDERQRRDDHLVARADARRVQRELQRRRATGRGDRVGGADALGEGGFERAAPAGPGRPSRSAITSRDRLAPRRPRGRAWRTGPPSRRATHAGARRRGRGCARSARHHSTRRRSPSSRSTSASKPRRSRASVVSASRRGTLLTGALGPELDRDVGAHHLDQQRCASSQQAGLDAAGDVEHLVGRLARSRRGCSRGRRRSM